MHNLWQNLTKNNINAVIEKKLKNNFPQLFILLRQNVPTSECILIEIGEEIDHLHRQK
jgi:hypothetical protein